jgi:hypothetical protein
MMHALKGRQLLILIDAPFSSRLSRYKQQRGTERAPSIIKSQQPEQAQKESPANNERRPDWLKGWGAGRPF